MRNAIQLLTIISLVIFFVSCRKDTVDQSQVPQQPADNKFPVAKAGNDTTIEFPRISPASTILLNGSLSYDPDGSIHSYEWKKISGPGAYELQNANNKIAFLSYMVPGRYIFKLTVTDDRGAVGVDTIVVEGHAEPRPISNLHFELLENHPVNGFVSVVADNKIFFAGSPYSATVDIYDINTNTWSGAQLSKVRNKLAAVSAGNKVFFAGGELFQLLYFDPIIVRFTRVDIYNTSTNSWSTSELSIARGAGIVATAAGDKVFFAGGCNSNTVDVYSLSTDTWSTEELTEVRNPLSIATAGNKVFFTSNAISTTVDVYDVTTNLWSAFNISDVRNGITGIGMGNEIFWAGADYIHNDISGVTYNIEIYEANTQDTSFATTYWPAPTPIKIVPMESKMLFIHTGLPPDKSYTLIDIYDLSSNSWSIAQLNENLTGAIIIAAGNKLYVTGGADFPGRVATLGF